MKDTTLYDNLKKANEEYHEAVDEILADETVPVDVKVLFSYSVKKVFDFMMKANNTIKEHYLEEEPEAP